MSDALKHEMHARHHLPIGADPSPPSHWIYVGDYPDDDGTTVESPVFENGWENAPGGQPLRFRLDLSWTLIVEGDIRFGEVGTVVTTIPEDYRRGTGIPAPGIIKRGDGSYGTLVWFLDANGELSLVAVGEATSDIAEDVASLIDGDGLSASGGVLNVNVDESTIEIAADTLQVKASGITANEIAADAVGSSEIAANAVGSSELADNAVDTNAIQDDAVTAAKIAAGAVGASELASTAVTPGTYGDATHVGQFTVDADGRLTAAADVAITGTGGASPDDDHVWMPLTTVVAGAPELVWDADDNLIPTYIPI